MKSEHAILESIAMSVQVRKWRCDKNLQSDAHDSPCHMCTKSSGSQTSNPKQALCPKF